MSIVWVSDMDEGEFFFRRGTINVYFQMEGNMPDESELLNRKVSAGMMDSATSLNIAKDMSSWPRPLDAALDKTHLTSACVTVENLKR